MFYTNDGWMDECRCDSVSLCGSKLRGGYNGWMDGCMCDLVSLHIQGPSYMVDSDAMSVSS